MSNGPPFTQTIWSFNAMAAAPTPRTIREDLVEAQAGKIFFKEGKEGTAVLICPVAFAYQVNWGSLWMTYRDGSGWQNRDNFVSAELRSVRMSDGHVQTLPGGTVSSREQGAPNSGPAGWATQEQSPVGQLPWGEMELDDAYYYVQVSMRRDDAGVPLGFMGVRMEGNPRWD